MVSSSTSIEFYVRLKKRSILVLKSVQFPENDYSNEIQQIDDFILSRNKPKLFHGSTGLEVRMIKSFEQTCILLKQNNVSDNPKKMTTLAFYEALAVVKEQMKQRNKKK